MPIVVGGTGFYLRWYVHGRPQTPASTDDSMQRVRRRLTEVRLLSMYLSEASTGDVTAAEASPVGRGGRRHPLE